MYLKLTEEYCGVQSQNVEFQERRDTQLDHVFDHVSRSCIMYDLLKLNSLTGVNSPRICISMCGLQHLRMALLLTVRLLIKALTQ